MTAPDTRVRTGGLDVTGLTVDYGNGTGLWDFDLHVGAGEVTCVIGRNGAGKSSALLGIAGFVTPTAGTVAIGGAKVSGAPYRRCRTQLSLVVKGRSLFGSLTLAENLSLARIDPDEFFDLFPQLASRRDVAAGSLSGGQQQLAAVGRALLRDVRVVLLDELTFGLSPAVRALIARVVREQAPDVSWPSSWSSSTWRPPWRSATAPSCSPRDARSWTCPRGNWPTAPKSWNRPTCTRNAGPIRRPRIPLYRKPIFDHVHT